MRPLKLQMTAFGPFSGHEQLDFTRLGENPLFLINGPTGSGKTTILDAICFALYGKTTGDEREGGQMRCDLAAAELLTEVSLEFELYNRIFRIRRVPEQQRPKSRGEGFTEQKPEAQLCELNADGSENLLVSSKLKEATREIENLTGLSVDQFRQVMVLPQGKFRQLLMAESAEREKIFSQLFQTRIYKRLEELLKTQSAEIRRERERQLQLQQGILAGAELESLEALEAELQVLLPEDAAAAQQKEAQEQSFLQAGQALQQAQNLADGFKRLAATEVALGELLQQKQQIERDRKRMQQAELAQKLLPSFAERSRCEAELRQADQEYAASKQERERCGKLLETAEAELKNAEQLQLDLDQAKQQAAELFGYRARVEQLAAAHAVLQKAAGEAAVAELQLNYKQLAEQYAQRLTLDRLAKEFARQQELLQREAQQGTELRERFEQTKQQAKTLELAWHQGQAAILAAELKAGEPCPVCGSSEHPAPAMSDLPLPTQPQLEQAREVAQRANEQLNVARERYAAGKQKLQNLEQQLENSHVELATVASRPIDEFEAALNDLRNNAGELSVALPELQQVRTADLLRLRDEAETKKNAAVAAGAQVQAAEKELPKEYRQLGTLDRAVLEVQQRATRLEKQLNTAAEKHKTALGKAEAASAAAQAAERHQLKLQQALEAAYAACRTAIEKSPFAAEREYQAALLAEQTFAALRQQLADYDVEWQRLSGALHQQQDALREKEPPDLERLELQLKTVEEEKNRAVSHWQQLDKRLSLLTSTQQKLARAAEQQSELDRKYAIIGTLSDVANGQTGDKVSLQRFVLSVLLDDVLIEASQRLSLMSKGRYRLLRKEERAKGNKASGLELEVEDAYTGKVRAVATLSGGESFMAALALALGLSDVVQAYAGGIRLDTLFIDEGFGSLDAEALDLAVRTLIDLQATGRMVGVISHVTELKEQMPLRIDLLVDRLGSRTRLVTP